MKKVISKFFFIISLLPYIWIIYNGVKCYFYGCKVVTMSGLYIPLTYGFKAIYNWFWLEFSFYGFGIITLPILIICIIYQIIYLKKKIKR